MFVHYQRDGVEAWAETDPLGPEARRRRRLRDSLHLHPEAARRHS